MSLRFRYHRYTDGDLAPPHGVWDTVEDKPASGTYSTENLAHAHCNGMNDAWIACEAMYSRIHEHAGKLRTALDALTPPTNPHEAKR